MLFAAKTGFRKHAEPGSDSLLGVDPIDGPDHPLVELLLEPPPLRFGPARRGRGGLMQRRRISSGGGGRARAHLSLLWK